MIKFYTVRITLITILLLCCIVFSQDNVEDKYSIAYNSWEKAIIIDSKINALLPYKLNKEKEPADDLYPSLMLTLSSINFKNELSYSSIPLKIETDIDNIIKDYSIAFQNYSTNHPSTWDLNDFDNLFCNDVFEGSGEEIFIRIKKHKKIKRNTSSKSVYTYNEQRTVLYNKVYRRNSYKTVDENGKTVYKKKPFDPREGVIFSICCNDDDSLNLYMLNQEQVLVWKVKFDEGSKKNNKMWEFQYAFKLPITRDFEICRIGLDLYILIKETGIYKLDIWNAKRNTPEPPKDVFIKYDNRDTLIWDGFLQEHIVKNTVKAKKVSELKYDYFVVDKDNNTGYVAVNNYLYELGKFKFRIKIPELRETETFLDKQAERMRAVLEAIYFMKVRYEKTPAHLLKVTSDKDIAEAEAKKLQTRESADGDDAEDADKTDQGENNDKTDTNAGNNGANANGNVKNPANAEDSTNKNADTNNQNIATDNTNNDDSTDESIDESDNANNKTDDAGLTDETDILTYLGISFAAIIILSIVLLPLLRKRRA